MEIYSNKDIKEFDDQIDDIIEKTKFMELDKFGPSLHEFREVNEIILSFLKEKKRKIYGGYAHDMILKNKNKNYSIYKEIDLADIDFYSPEPVNDVIDLCNRFHEKKYKLVEGREAVHEGTYRIFVNTHQYIDISYVPNNIYHRMPYIDINGINVIHPHFIFIDFLRIYTNPFDADWRWKKTMPRFQKLLNYYPLKNIQNKLQLVYNRPNDDVYKVIMMGLEKHLVTIKSIVYIGFKLYNHFISKSNYNKCNKIDIPYFEVISDNYKEHASSIKKYLLEKFKMHEKDIKIEEYYPLFDLYGYNSVFYYKTYPLLHIFSNNNRCVPYKEVKEGSNTLLYSTFDNVLMYNMILTIRARVIKDKKLLDMRQIITSDLLNMRKHYLKTNNKTVLDDTPFQSFVITCTGPVITPFQMMNEKVEKRKKQNKPYVWKYIPSANKKNVGDINFNFPNVSGNLINNIKNLQIT